MYSPDKFEGDIALTQEEIIALKNGDFKNAILNKYQLWTDGIVPFFINNGDFTEGEKQLIYQAMEAYHKETCIR